MTASKDSVLNRTAPANRLSVGSATANVYKMHPRPHSHSLSVGSLNPAHRVTRRKSMSNTVRDTLGSTLEPGNYSGKKSSKSPLATGGQKTAFPASLPSGNAFGQAGYDAKYGSAVADGPPLESLPEDEKGNGKARSRRASEGSQLRKGESKRASGGELRCETCGKGYKHSSCLTKHLWEHTPEWQYTSKLLISKHQQVQLLEAASVLVAMNIDGVATDSDSSCSPAASGSSDLQDSEMSSAETTPPPQLDDAGSGFHSATRSEFGSSKRFSTNSSAYSHSYQSSVFSESVPNSRPYMSHYRQWSTDGRPTTSGTSVNGDDQDQADLAAAVGLLSCSFGTPKTGPVMLPADVPPVPPLPSQFLGHKADHLSGTPLTFAGAPQSYSSYVRERKLVVGDIDMDNSADEDEVERDRHRRARSDDDDEGMFGLMEE